MTHLARDLTLRILKGSGAKPWHYPPPHQVELRETSCHGAGPMGRSQQSGASHRGCSECGYLLRRESQKKSMYIRQNIVIPVSSSKHPSKHLSSFCQANKQTSKHSMWQQPRFKPWHVLPLGFVGYRRWKVLSNSLQLWRFAAFSQVGASVPTHLTRYYTHPPFILLEL